MTKEWSTDAMNARIIKMARKYSLDAGKLKDVMISRCRGMNNCEISDCCGLNRNTANKYVSVLGGGRDKILPYNVTNPCVCPRDVEHVLTFRPEWWREKTLKELVDHGISSKVNLLMNPRDTDVHPHESVNFKARVLNEMQFDVYVDNDDILRRNLQPLTSARCVSVEEFYMAGQNNIRLVI